MENVFGLPPAAADLVAQWDARVAELQSENNGVFAAGLPDLLGIVLKVMPFILTLITGGFSWPLLLTVLPGLLKELFPTLDSGLLAILTKIIELFAKK